MFTLEQDNEKGIIEALAQHGVVSVLIDATGFQNYAGGIFSGQDECSSYSWARNHAVVLVGYTPNYYILRNSWGSQWGEQGYMKLKSIKMLSFIYIY